MARKGPLTAAEKEFIGRNAGIVDPADIALRLDRSDEVVLKFLRSVGASKKAIGEAEASLRSSMAWRHLAFEFNGDEVAYFEERYTALKEQFKDDVLASEEASLFKAVKLEILMHRNLVQQKRAEAEIDRLETDKAGALSAPGKFDTERFAFMDAALQGAYASKQAKTSEYAKLDNTHQDILKSLKSTREQRISKVESSKRTFLDIIRMLSEQDAADRADRQIDQMRKATDKELRRLGGVHVYADGTPDRPILNAETVLLDDGGRPPAASLPEHPTPDP